MSIKENRIVESICWNTMRFLGYETYFAKRPRINPIGEFLYQRKAYIKTIYNRYLNRFKLRKEPVNRRATHNLIDELTAKYR